MVRIFALAALALVAVAGPASANDFSDAIFATPIRSSPGTMPAGRDLDRDGFLNGPCANDCVQSKEQVGWLTLEYLYWATQGPTAPPLVTTGPAILGPGLAGFVGLPTTQNLFGGERVLNGPRSGFRASGGLFLDSASTWALSHTSISLGSRSERLEGGSNGTNVVNVPQFGTILGVPFQAPLYVGFPGLTRGTVTASAQTSFYSGDAHLHRVYQSGNGFRFDVLAGYRFLQLGDTISDSFDVVPAAFPVPRLMGEDSVRTRNYFHGGEVGFNFQGRVGRLAFELQSTVALGSTTTWIDRSQTRSLILGAGLGALLGVPLPPVGIPLVQTGGRTAACDFAVAPQIGFKLGWQPVDHVWIKAGYDFLYWSRVRRAQELFAGDNATTDFWAQGLSLGAELRY